MARGAEKSLTLNRNGRDQVMDIGELNAIIAQNSPGDPESNVVVGSSGHVDPAEACVREHPVMVHDVESGQRCCRINDLTK